MGRSVKGVEVRGQLEPGDSLPLLSSSLITLSPDLHHDSGLCRCGEAEQA